MRSLFSYRYQHAMCIAKFTSDVTKSQFTLNHDVKSCLAAQDWESFVASRFIQTTLGFGGYEAHLLFSIDTS